jgi:hypothetical protein
MVRADLDLEKATELDWSIIPNGLSRLDLDHRKNLIASYLFYKNGNLWYYIGKIKSG